MKSRIGLVLLAVALALTTGCGASGDGETDDAPAGTAVDVGAPLPGNVKDKGKLAVGVKCDYPPFGYIDEAAKNAGFEIDVARKLASYAFGDADNVELTCVTGANRVSFLTTNRIDLIIATMNYTKERAETIDFTTPYFSSGVKLLVPKDSPITSFPDLAGKSVISTNGATASLWLTQCMKDVKQVLFGQTSEALTALKQERADALAQDDTLLLDLAAKNPDLKVVGEGKAGSPWGMGVRKGDTAMLEWVNAAIKKLQTDEFFWTEFQKTVTDPNLQQQFAKFVPRPGNDLSYPTGSTLVC
ncbi:transporter substrate-binding domain-containing protein [Micromonospora sp. NPDC050417]|uniref:transporter substrate-binding domain-containing protein n=1 Tax=Micromonospora sp. NPDC050417 TaxID=3364280 RepID=UPI00379956AE